MDETSFSIDPNIIKKPIKTDVKDNDNTVQFTEPLIEPILALNTDKSVDPSATKIKRFSGIYYAFLAAIFFTCPVFVTKQLKVELLDALFLRFLLQSIGQFIYIKFIKHYSLWSDSKKQEIFFLIFNVVFSSTGFLAFFVAYRYLPLPDLTTIRYSQVVWTTIITSILYCEKPTVPTILAILLTTIGVTLVAQPSFLFGQRTSNLTTNDRYQRSIGLGIALYSSVAMSLMVISNRHLLLKYKTKHSLITLQFSFVSLCIVIIHFIYKYYFLTDKIHSMKNDFLNWNYICASLVCLLQIVASILTQKALKREHPSIFTIVQSSDILIAILLQYIFASIKSNFLTIIGSFFVLTSILIISGFKLFNEKKKKNDPIETESDQ